MIINILLEAPRPSSVFHQYSILLSFNSIAALFAAMDMSLRLILLFVWIKEQTLLTIKKKISLRIMGELKISSFKVLVIKLSLLGLYCVVVYSELLIAPSLLSAHT